MKTAFVVLGMHRSGTSSVAGSLACLGVTPPATLLEPSEDNPRGFWESRVIISQNDSILLAGGSYWHDWRAFDAGLIDTARRTDISREIAQVLASEFGGASEIVLKDPRLCRLYPFWDGPLAEAGYRPGFILPIRSPLEVAASLFRRNGIPVADGLLLWLRHVLDAERMTRERPRQVLIWTEFMADWRGAVAAMAPAFDWQAPDLHGARAAAVDGFLSVDLRHEVTQERDMEEDPEAHIWPARAWAALKALAHSGDCAAVREELDRLGELMDVSSVLYGRAYGAVLWDAHEARLERDAEVAARQAAVETESELHHRLAAAANEGRVLQEALAEREARIAALDGHIANTTVQLDRLAKQSEAQAHRADQAEGAVAALSVSTSAQAARVVAQQAALTTLQQHHDQSVAQLQRQLEAAVQTEADLSVRFQVESAALADLRDRLRQRPLAIAWRAWRKRGLL